MMSEKCRNQELLLQEVQKREKDHNDLRAEADALRLQIKSTRYVIVGNISSN